MIDKDDKRVLIIGGNSAGLARMAAATRLGKQSTGDIIQIVNESPDTPVTIKTEKQHSESNIRKPLRSKNGKY